MEGLFSDFSAERGVSQTKRDYNPPRASRGCCKLAVVRLSAVQKSLLWQTLGHCSSLFDSHKRLYSVNSWHPMTDLCAGGDTREGPAKPRALWRVDSRDTLSTSEGEQAIRGSMRMFDTPPLTHTSTISVVEMPLRLTPEYEPAPAQLADADGISIQEATIRGIKEAAAHLDQQPLFLQGHNEQRLTCQEANSDSDDLCHLGKKLATRRETTIRRRRTCPSEGCPPLTTNGMQTCSTPSRGSRRTSSGITTTARSARRRTATALTCAISARSWPLHTILAKPTLRGITYLRMR